MFCGMCGTQLSDNAKFCSNCGAKTSNSDNSALQIPNGGNDVTKLVPAKCTNCGGQLTVDENQKSAICPFCNTSFIVEQAINNYNVQINGNMSIGNATININGLNTANLVARANAFESQNNWEKATEYYNRVLDIDINNSDAIQGIKRIKQKQRDLYIRSLMSKAKSYEIINKFDEAIIYFRKVLEVDKENMDAIRGISRVEQKKKDYVYITALHKTLLRKTETIEVRRDKITVLKENGEIDREYFIKKISGERCDGGQIIFNYPGKVWMPEKLNCGAKAYDVYLFIKKAKDGIYPEYTYV